MKKDCSRQQQVSHGLMAVARAAAISLFVAVGLLSAAPAENASAFDILIQKAHALEARDRLDLAAQVWQQILVTNPNQPEALAGLLHWAQRSGNTAEANAYLARLRKVNPDAATVAELNAHKPSAATGAPPDRRLAEAARLSAARHYVEAMRVYRDVFGNNPPRGWAIAYYETEAQTPDGFDAAIAALRKLAHDHPDAPEYAVAEGRLLTYRPASRAAGVALLAEIPVGGPGATLADEALRQALIWEKQNPAFAPAMRKYLARHADAELQAGLDALESHTALAGAHAATESVSSKAEGAGYAALKRADVSTAEREFTSALRANPRSVAALTGLGFVRMKQANFAAAVEQFEAAQKQRPKSADIRDALVSARFWLTMQTATQAGAGGNLADAIDSYRAALALRPTSPEALRGLTGAYLQANQASPALPYFATLLHLLSAQPDDWQRFIEAKRKAEGSDAALAALQSVPAAVSGQLASTRAFLILQATIYFETGDAEQASRLLSEVESENGAPLTPQAELELATVLVTCHRAGEAEDRLARLVARDTENPAAWETLISASVAAGHYEAAEQAFEQMPATVRRRTIQHPGLLSSLAAAEASLGRTQEAESLLNRILELPDRLADGKTKSDAAMQLAPILAKNGETVKAESLVRAAIEAHPADDKAWKTYLLLLGGEQRGPEIAALLHRMPPAVALRFNNDPDTVTLLAAARAANGDAEGGARLLTNYLSRPAAQGSAESVKLQIQLCWLLLDVPANGRELFRALNTLRASSALTPEQQSEVANIWTTWILRAAEAARQQGDLARASAVLEGGLQLFPKNGRMQGALAGDLLKAGNAKSALSMYANWGLAGAAAADYAGAIGAALMQRNYVYADAWIEKGLAQWPGNPQLLTLAGDRARSKGDLKHAESYWREALTRRQSAPASPSTSTPVSGQNLEQLLLGAEASPAPGFPSDSFKTQSPSAALQPAYSPAAIRAHLANLVSGNGSEAALVPVSNAEPVEPAPAVVGSPLAGAASPVAQLVASTPTDDPQDRLDSLESRNTPFLNSGVTLQSRSGQAGFDRLLIEQANFEASTTIADQVRVSLAVKPTYLSTGASNGSGTLGLGTSPATSPFGAQAAGGVAADAQLSTQTFGAHLGVSPEGFLIHNVVGGVRYNPGDGPFTFQFERDDVRDTMLSFAGEQDPLTKQVWGGVIANTGTVAAHKGDDMSGLYASLSYQSLSGRGVESNRALNANFGTYWRVLTTREGALTLGLNFDAMHYDRNLRYFTLGQGGYFSPQQYFLFGVPFRWTGTYHKRLQYIIGGALGAQHFAEDESPFFPTDAALQASARGGMYAAQASTGANFSLDARLNYQLAPNWLLGFWANANNARNYTSSSAGLFVKYTFQARPLSLENGIASVPDWKGQQPFTLF